MVILSNRKPYIVSSRRDPRQRLLMLVLGWGKIKGYKGFSFSIIVLYAMLYVEFGLRAYLLSYLFMLLGS